MGGSIVVCASGVCTASVDVISDVFVVVSSIAVVPLVCGVSVDSKEQNYMQMYSNGGIDIRNTSEAVLRPQYSPRPSY